MDNKEIDYIVWDLETTGFDAPNDKILEIGMYVVRGEEVEKKQWLINNNVDIPDKIVEITGITNELIDAEGKEPKECLLEAIEIMKNAKRNVTHNGIRFDIPFFVKYAADVLNWSEDKTQKAYDTLYSTAYDTAAKYKSSQLNMDLDDDENYLENAKKIMNIRQYGLKYNLGLVSDVLGIDRSNIVQHRALGDVELTHEIYKKYDQRT